MGGGLNGGVDENKPCSYLILSLPSGNKLGKHHTLVTYLFTGNTKTISLDTHQAVQCIVRGVSRGTLPLTLPPWDLINSPPP